MRTHDGINENETKIIEAFAFENCIVRKVVGKIKGKQY
jgi:hypothetical protein